MSITIDSMVGLIWKALSCPVYGSILCASSWYFMRKNIFIYFMLLIQAIATYNSFSVRYKRRGQWDQLSATDVAIVTGGSRGLGLEIVRLLQAKKVKVVIIDVIHPEVSTSNETEFFFHCDVGHQRQLEATIDEIQNTIGRVTILVNNAGVRHDERLLNLSREKIERIFNINMFSHITLLKKVIGKITSNDRLFVVTVSSILGTIGPSNLSIYSASKSSVIQIHDSLSHELSHKQNIRFLLVTPGQLDTTMFKDVKVSNEFLAPVVKAKVLAADIVNRISMGERGHICTPLYTNFLPAMKVLPYCIQELLRRYSDMDNQIRDT